MRPRRSLSLLGVIAIAALAACSDAPTASPTSPAVVSPPAPTYTSIDGPIVRGAMDASLGSSGLMLATGRDLDVVWLAGDAGPLQDLVGMDITAHGRLEGTILYVDEFEVRGIDGKPVWDGLLERIVDDDSYGVRLRDGSLHTLSGVADDLAAYVGRRVWVAHDENGGVAKFGVIAVDL